MLLVSSVVIHQSTTAPTPTTTPTIAAPVGPTVVTSALTGTAAPSPGSTQPAFGNTRTQRHPSTASTLAAIPRRARRIAPAARIACIQPACDVWIRHVWRVIGHDDRNIIRIRAPSRRRVIAVGRLLAILLLAFAHLVIHAVELLLLRDGQGGRFAVARFDGVVSRDVRSAFLVADAGEVFLDLLVGAAAEDDAGSGGSVRFTDGFAVPACAFRVWFLEHCLIDQRGPFEGGSDCGGGDLVIVVDEAGGFGDTMAVVFWRTELVRMPDRWIAWSVEKNADQSKRRSDVRTHHARSISSVGTAVRPVCWARIVKYRSYFKSNRCIVDRTAGECSQSMACIFSINDP